MKSPMVENAAYIPDKSGYTDLQVCQSAAGYYVGTMYRNIDDDGNLQFEEPGSRDSGYYATEEEAQKYLDMVTAQDKPEQFLRTHPAQGTRYDDGTL